MPWRTPPHFSMTRWATEGEIGWAAEIAEKARERSGMVRLGVGGGALGLGVGFLRWCSLIAAWNLSAKVVSSGERLGFWGVSG